MKAVPSKNLRVRLLLEVENEFIKVYRLTFFGIFEHWKSQGEIAQSQFHQGFTNGMTSWLGSDFQNVLVYEE